jgi:hypothetical protein
MLLLDRRDALFFGQPEADSAAFALDDDGALASVGIGWFHHMMAQLAL